MKAIQKFIACIARQEEKDEDYLREPTLLILSPLTFIIGFILSFVIGWKLAVWVFLAGILYYLSVEILSPYLGDLGQCIFLVFTPIYTLLNLAFQDEKPQAT